MQKKYQLQEELPRLLQLSTLAPGDYKPSEYMKENHHIAVFAGERPVILCGPRDDPESVRQAEALAESEAVGIMFNAAGKEGPVTYRTVAGGDIVWKDVHSCLVQKPSGQLGMGDQDGPMVAVVFDDSNHALTTGLCVTTETARIFDPAVPELANR